MKKVYAKGFKGFNPGMTCRGKQYKENTVFTEKEAKMCEKGMHFCENPLDVLNYYPLLNLEGELSEFAEVEALASVKTEGDKSVTTKLKVGKKLPFKEFIEAAVKFLLGKGTAEIVQASSGIYSHLAASGNYSQLAASGDRSCLAASGGDSQLAASGDGSHLVASGIYSHLAASGYRSHLAASGDGSHLVASGNGSHLAASGKGSQLAASGNDSHLAASGNGSHLAASGEASHLAASGNGSHLAASGGGSIAVATGECSYIQAGENAVAAAMGARGRVKGALGASLVCAEWDSQMLVGVKSVKVDGKKIKADTWYTVIDGEWVEVD